MIDNRTTELREKLAKCNVEFTTDAFNHIVTTNWWVDNIYAKYIEDTRESYVDENYPTLKLWIKRVTPEQAIAATLGGGTLTAEQVCETVLKHGNVMGPRFYGDWQAIADELNATLSSETCEQGADMDVKNKVMRVKSGKYQGEKYVVEDYAYNVWGSHDWYQNLNNFAILNFILDHKGEQFNPETAVYGKIGCFGYVMLLDELEEVCDD